MTSDRTEGATATAGGRQAASGAPADPPHFALLNEIGIIDQLASRLFERLLPDGLTVPQFGVLNHFARLGRPSSPSRLARNFQVTKGAMTNTLHHLERKGFVAVRPNAEDARQKLVDITPAGRAARDRAVAAAAPALARLATAIPERDVGRALPVLAALRAYLDRERDAYE
ncbi:MAG: MarR family transcriptional regulator [Azospirillaceae bacterium]